MQEKYLYRKITTLIKGQNLGGITRYISPAYYGQLTKPFVFLDYVRILPNQPLPKFGFHPHSGIATLTFMLEGESWYEETSGKKGILNEGDIEWMSSGGGVWHRGGPQSPPVRGFQLWIALPPEQESSPPRSQYIKKDDIPQEGSATVLLGRYGSSHSPVQTPVDINYLSVTLEKNQRWVYEPPADHDVAWLLLYEGNLLVGEQYIKQGELAVFEANTKSIELIAEQHAGFIFGSAPLHPYPLVTGDYSVHTSPQSLIEGEKKIAQIAQEFNL
ncbi:pirin family protein [Acinetobacter sp. 3657]|uniref:pirin family protein n=1 Tax=Acinetobacter sp. 3657 TaxID=2817764 RepID=UPI00286101D2|nr:redox-sensitive bicupin YhaK (pirin superfamily) [Prolinoborus sp. 3657]